MAKSQKTNQPWPHEDEALFRDAVSSTAGSESFTPELIEKDYFCSVILKVVYNSPEPSLVFKGGTLLNKVHSGFYRMSEDLDFSISVSPGARRSDRSTLAAPVKMIFQRLPKSIPSVRVQSELKGANGSAQYNGVLEYRSVFQEKPQTITLQIGLRERVFYPERHAVKTLLQNPIRNIPMIEPFQATCLSRNEAYAEKLRAALTRKVPAIRDLYDIQKALELRLIDFRSRESEKLVIEKLLHPDAAEIDLSDSWGKQLRAQMETDLRPVLRPSDYAGFDFETAWTNLRSLGVHFRSRQQTG